MKPLQPVLPVQPVKSVQPARTVKTVKPVAAPAKPAPISLPKRSNMARPPVAKTKRVVPSVPSGRGVVRTDTHNAANQVPAAAKHKKRGL
jgi:hypothetical protein